MTEPADALQHEHAPFLVQLSARLQEPPGDGPWVRVDVEDDGRGMSEHTLSRIFDPFFTTKGTGRGLGMAAVMGILSRHEGGLAVRSAPGEGTTFTLVLQRDTLPRQPTADTGKRGRILLAEDDPQVRSWLEAELRRAGHTIHTVDDGPPALQALLDGDYDLAVLDVVMPTLSGAAVLERLRDQGKDIATLFITGFTDGRDLPKGARVTVRSKPLGRDELLATVQELLA